MRCEVLGPTRFPLACSPPLGSLPLFDSHNPHSHLLHLLCPLALLRSFALLLPPSALPTTPRLPQPHTATDCPQREKRGWTGDAQFTSRQASLNLDMRQLYGNWLQTMQDHDNAGCAIGGAAPVFPQTNKDICCNPSHSSFGCDYTGIPNGTFSRPGGSVADVVPFMYVGGWPGDPSWGSISAVLPYTVWKGGDDTLVSTYYDAAKRNVDFFLREAAEGSGGLIEFGYYGDWCSLTTTDKPQVTSTSQIMVTSHIVDMAQHLGKTADAASYNATLHGLRAAYHAKYWDAGAKSYRGGTQTANLMPLILDIPPPAARAQAAAAFVASVEAAGNATDSGLVGASFVLQALVAAGRGDIALSMAMREEKPSWGYMVKQVRAGGRWRRARGGERE